MELNVLTIILIITVIVSLMAFNNREMMDKMLFVPYDVKHSGNYSRFLFHMLIHADYMHLAFNMMSVYFLGSMFLDFDPSLYMPQDQVGYGLMQTYGPVMGQVHFVILYVAGGLFATLIPYARNQDNPSYRSLGASGAVSAVIFASILWNPNMELQLLFIPIPIKGYIFAILYLAFEYYADKRGNSGVAHDAHIGGAIFGIFYILIINIDKGKELIGYFF